MTLLIGQVAFPQNGKAKVQSDENFYFYYGIAGMGSGLGSLQPTLKIHNTQFVYAKEQNSYWGKRAKKKEFISKGLFRQSSIDSILSAIQYLKDTSIYRVNPCIMSGGIIFITIAYGSDTTKFTLHNTFDFTALKIIEIVNPYLPKDRQLYGSADEIKEEVDCLTYVQNKVEQQIKDSIKAKQ